MGKIIAIMGNLYLQKTHWLPSLKTRGIKEIQMKYTEVIDALKNAVILERQGQSFYQNVSSKSESPESDMS